MSKPIRLLKPEKVCYNKPLAIIVNPNAGRKRDPRPLIKARLDMAGIPFEFLLSTRPSMSWEISANIDFDKYSGIISVGGDGTLHDVVNGMLNRTDKKRLPIGVIPNGSANGAAEAISIQTIDEALDYILKGDSIKIDVTKVLLDHEEEEELVGDPDKFSKFRYQLLINCIGFGTTVTRRALNWKWCCCISPYVVAGLIEIPKLKYDKVDIYNDGHLIF